MVRSPCVASASFRSKSILPYQQRDSSIPFVPGPGSYTEHYKYEPKANMNFNSMDKRIHTPLMERVRLSIPGPAQYDTFLRDSVWASPSGQFGQCFSPRRRPILQSPRKLAQQAAQIAPIPNPPSIPMQAQAWGYEEGSGGALILQAPTNPGEFSLPRGPGAYFPNTSYTLRSSPAADFTRLTGRDGKSFGEGRAETGPSSNPSSGERREHESWDVVGESGVGESGDALECDSPLWQWEPTLVPPRKPMPIAANLQRTSPRAQERIAASRRILNSEMGLEQRALTSRAGCGILPKPPAPPVEHYSQAAPGMGEARPLLRAMPKQSRHFNTMPTSKPLASPREAKRLRTPRTPEAWREQGALSPRAAAISTAGDLSIASGQAVRADDIPAPSHLPTKPPSPPVQGASASLIKPPTPRRKNREVHVPMTSQAPCTTQSYASPTVHYCLSHSALLPPLSIQSGHSLRYVHAIDCAPAEPSTH